MSKVSVTQKPRCLRIAQEEREFPICSRIARAGKASDLKESYCVIFIGYLLVSGYFSYACMRIIFINRVAVCSRVGSC